MAGNVKLPTKETVTMKNKPLIAAIIVLAAAISAYAYTSTPKSYDDCVLKNIEKAENTAAASVIVATCRAKFPEGPNPFDQFDKK